MRLDSHGEFPSVMIGSHIDKTGIASDVVNSVGVGARHFRVGEIVTLNFDRLFCRKPLLTGIVVVAYQFFLFCVHRNDRRALRHAFFNGGIDVPKLRIAIGVVCAFLGLPIYSSDREEFALPLHG